MMASPRPARLVPLLAVAALLLVATEAWQMQGPLRMTAEPPLGVGVIGCGRIGQIHSNTLAFRTPGARLVAVTDPFEEMGRKCVEQVGGIPDYHKEYKELLDRPDVQAVVVA